MPAAVHRHHADGRQPGAAGRSGGRCVRTAQHGYDRLCRRPAGGKGGGRTPRRADRRPPGHRHARGAFPCCDRPPAGAGQRAGIQDRSRPFAVRRAAGHADRDGAQPWLRRAGRDLGLHGPPPGQPRRDRRDADRARYADRHLQPGGLQRRQRPPLCHQQRRYLGLAAVHPRRGAQRGRHRGDGQRQAPQVRRRLLLQDEHERGRRRGRHRRAEHHRACARWPAA